MKKVSHKTEVTTPTTVDQIASGNTRCHGNAKNAVPGGAIGVNFTCCADEVGFVDATFSRCG